MPKLRDGIARSVLIVVATAGLVAALLPAVAQDRRFHEGHGVERGFQGGRAIAYGAPRGAGYHRRMGADPHWHNADFRPGPGRVGWGPRYGWRSSVGGWGVGGWGRGWGWGWGWGAGWSWNGVVVIGGPVALFATPPIVFAPPPIYVAPPPIVLGIPAPPVVAAIPPPTAVAPPVARSLPLPPQTLLVAAAPPPIVILPPPAVIVAAAPPTLFFSPPFVAFASFGVGGWGWGGWAWGGHGWAWGGHGWAWGGHGWGWHEEAPRAWQSRGWGSHSVGFVPAHARGPGAAFRMPYGGLSGGRFYGGRSYAVRRADTGRR